MPAPDAGSYGFPPINRPRFAPRVARAILRLEAAEKQAWLFRPDAEHEAALRLRELWAAERAEMDPEEKELALRYDVPAPHLPPSAPGFVPALDAEP